MLSNDECSTPVECFAKSIQLLDRARNEYQRATEKIESITNEKVNKATIELKQEIDKVKAESNQNIQSAKAEIQNQIQQQQNQLNDLNNGINQRINNINLNCYQARAATCATGFKVVSCSCGGGCGSWDIQDNQTRCHCQCGDWTSVTCCLINK